MIKHFSNKRYWILMPPFFITGVLLVIFLPRKYVEYAVFLLIIVYWAVYSLWNYYAEKTNKSRRQH